MNQELVEICLRIRDLEASLDFYTNLFDFEVASRREFPEDKFDLVYLNSPSTSVQIELTYNYDAEPYNVGNGFSHLGVTVSDLEEMHEICKASAYETGELRGLSGGHPLISLLLILMATELKSSGLNKIFNILNVS